MTAEMESCAVAIIAAILLQERNADGGYIGLLTGMVSDDPYQDVEDAIRNGEKLIEMVKKSAEGNVKRDGLERLHLEEYRRRQHFNELYGKPRPFGDEGND